MSERESPWARWIWLLPAIVVPALLAAPFVAGQIFLFRDVLHYTAPQLAGVADAVHAWHVPEWNPALFSGTPVLAEPGNRFLYPLTVLAAVLFPPMRAATAIVLFHLPLAGLGTYALARELNVERLSAALAGMAYAACGYLLSVHASGDYYFNSAAWLPGTLWTLARAARLARARDLAVAAIPPAMLVLNGDLQVPMLAGVIGLGFALVARSRRALGAVVAALALGGALGAIQLVPTLIFASGTVRAHGLSLAEATPWSLPPVRLVELLLALPFGVPYPENSDWSGLFERGQNEHAWALSLYLAPMLSIAAVALGGWRLRGAWRVIGIATVMALLLAMGSHTPVFRAWFTLVPLANRFRYPEKFLSVFSLGVALLGARALGRRTERTFGRALVAVFVGTAIVAVGIAGMVQLEPTWLDAAIAEGLRVGQAGIEAAVARANLLASAREAVAVCLGTALALWVRRKAQVDRPQLAVAGDVLLVLLVLGTTVPIGLRTLSYGEAPFLNQVPSLRGELAKAAVPGSTGRFFPAGTCRERRLPLDGATPLEENRAYGWMVGQLNYPELWGISTVTGYSAAVPAEIAQLKAHLPEFPSQRPARLLGAASIRSCDADGTPRVEAVERPLLRVAFTPAVGVPADQMLARYVSPDFDPGTAALVATEDLPPLPAPGAASARVTTDDPERVAIETGGAGGLLVLTDRFDRGWSVTIDGAPAPIVRANLLWRGVSVPKGVHRVEYRYRTPGLVLGAVVSALSLLLTLVLARRPKLSAS